MACCRVFYPGGKLMRQRPIAERVDELQQRIEALRQSKAQL